MNVVPLRPRTPPEAVPKRSAPRHTLTVDIQRAIDGLRSLRSDLEAYYWDRPADGPEDTQRFQVSCWIRQLADRSAALEGIVLYKSASRLRLCNVRASEAKQLQQALAAVEHPVYEEDPFEQVLQIVATALIAADRIGLRAAAARPD